MTHHSPNTSSGQVTGVEDTNIALEGAFREGEAAAGASAVRDGFTFAHASDVAFALGFPHACQWSRDDVSVDLEAEL